MAEQDEKTRKKQLEQLLWSPYDDNHLKQFDFEDGCVYMVYTVKDNPETNTASDVIRLVGTYPIKSESGSIHWENVWQDFPVTDPSDAAMMLLVFNQEYAHKWREERKEQSNQPNY
ncbi:hypothetical protein [Hymenobacter volaticus]|uniref:DUF551 domain-containing protein n=1 Tax=Hymenobacter volaticus TaxID=2932254 RepID=A0ABY4GD10_9BACT|nr:hypothetical protein [Hymenobacter volaticus]UOQ68774.1 hypothetical protein MUN86_25160 [Hymenobacter volaticus]